jgi:hypothetical protein
MEQEAKKRSTLVFYSAPTLKPQDFLVVRQTAPERPCLIRQLRAKPVSKSEREDLISNLFFKHTKRSGASVQTAKDVLAEFKLMNTQWQADRADVEKGLKKGFERLGYLEKAGWWWCYGELEKESEQTMNELGL